MISRKDVPLVIIGAILIASLFTILFFGSQLAEGAVEQGNHYFNVDGEGIYRLDRAAHFYRLALLLDPNVPDAWHQLARIDFLQGDLDGALRKINKQLGFHGENLIASFYIRGLIEGYRGNYEAAERDFLHYLALDPTNWAAHNDLAWVYFVEGRFGEAEAVARAGLEFDSINPWLLNSLGVALLGQGRKEEAAEVLDKAYRYGRILRPAHWSTAYPGNDPQIAADNLEHFKNVISANLRLVGNR